MNVLKMVVAGLDSGGAVLRKGSILLVGVLDGMAHGVVYGSVKEGVIAGLIFCLVMSSIGGLTGALRYLTTDKNS